MSPHGVEARFSVNNRKEFIGIYYSTQFATIVNEIKQKKKPTILSDNGLHDYYVAFWVLSRSAS